MQRYNHNLTLTTMQRHNNNLTMQYACGTNQRVEHKLSIQRVEQWLLKQRVEHNS